MTVKQVSVLPLFSVREAAKGFIISLRASNRYSPKYLTELESALALFARYAESQEWPSVASITTAHVEDYLAYLQVRPRWFGDRDTKGKPLSQSYIETQYRRLKRFFNWLVQRGHIGANPLDLIPHPHIDERTIPTVPEYQVINVLKLVDPALARTPRERFRMMRNKALLLILWDSPVRRGELASMTINGTDLDAGMIVVMGKGRRERWLPLGATATAALWDYMVLRRKLRTEANALWVSIEGVAIIPNSLYRTIKRLGERADIPDLHTHRFRHSYAVNALRAGMSEPMLRLVGGWKKIPDTYLRTLAAEDAARIHREISPADRLGDAVQRQEPKRPRGPSKGRL